LAVTRLELEERDRLISEKGLVIVVEDVEEVDEETGNVTINSSSSTPRKVLVTMENAQLLQSAGEGSLGW
jgi:LRRFIP family